METKASPVVVDLSRQQTPTGVSRAVHATYVSHHHVPPTVFPEEYDTGTSDITTRGV